MPSIKRSLRAAVLLMPFFLTACGIPFYRPDANERTVHARLMGLGNLSMCREHQTYFLPVHTDAKGTRWTYLPAGERIDLTSYNSKTVSTPWTASGKAEIECTARVSVVPREGIKLIVTGSTPGFNSCALEVVREDENTETGLSVEPSLQPSRQPKLSPIMKTLVDGPTC